MDRDVRGPGTRGADGCRALVDRFADGSPADQRRRTEEAFPTSGRDEWLSWEMAWRRETWPV